MEIVGIDPIVKARIIKRMSDIDALAPDLRTLVHEYGWTIVNSFLQLGVTKANQIQHLIRLVQQGSTEGKPRPLIFIDDIPATVAGNRLAVVPLEPTPLMIATSMAEVSNFNIQCSKEEKHRRRLGAAIAVGKVKSVSSPIDHAA